MYWISPILALVGLALLLYGFRKNNRVILVAAGFTLFLAGTITDMVEGFVAGVATEQSAAVALVSGPAAGNSL